MLNIFLKTYLGLSPVSLFLFLSIFYFFLAQILFLSLFTSVSLHLHDNFLPFKADYFCAFRRSEVMAEMLQRELETENRTSAHATCGLGGFGSSAFVFHFKGFATRTIHQAYCEITPTVVVSFSDFRG